MTSRTQVARALRATLHTRLCHPARVVTAVTAKLTNYCVGSNPAALYSSISRVPCVAKARTAFSTSATVLSVTRDNPDDLFASPRGGSNDDVTDTSDQEAEVDNHDRSTEWLPKRPPTTKPKGDDDVSLGKSPGSRLSTGATGTAASRWPTPCTILNTILKLACRSNFQLQPPTITLRLNLMVHADFGPLMR